MPFALLLLGLVVGGMCTLLMLNTASAANEVRRHDLAIRDAGIAAQVQQLGNQVAASAAPGALGSAAAQLGMVPAGNPAFLQIGPGGSVRVLGSAAPATGAAPITLPSVPTSKSPAVKSPAAKTATAPTHGSTAAGHATGKPSPGSAASTKAAPKPVTTPTPTTTLGGTR